MRLHSGFQALEFRSEMNDTRPLLVRRFILIPLQESPALSKVPDHLIEAS